jgi:subtilisin family serine protease
MEKLDPQLWTLLEQRERAHAQAVTRNERDAVRLADAPIEVHVEFDGESEALRSAGFPLYGLVPGAARGGLSPAQIRALIALPQVHFVGIPPQLPIRLDVSVPEIGARDAWAIASAVSDLAHGQGAGAIVGVIDSGIDVFHGAFRTADGTTRILALWDQTFRYDSTTNLPVDSSGAPLTGDQQPTDEHGAVLTPARAPTRFGANFNYGAEFTFDQIRAALAAHPDGKDLPRSLRDQPVNEPDGSVVYHGSNVAGIAAGNGAQNDKCTNPFTYVGVAPQADLVIVKTGVGPGQIQNVVDAAQYIFGIAAVPTTGHPTGKPCAINISLGGHTEPHNGQGLSGRGFEALTAGALNQGRAIVLSAGNDRALDLHAAFTIPRGTLQTVRVNLKVNTAKRFALFASYNPAAILSCVVRQPVSGAAVQTAPQQVRAANATQPLGSHLVQVRLVARAAADPDAHFTIVIAGQAGGNVMSGIWEFDIAATAAADANVHFWVTTPTGYASAILPFPGAVASIQDAERDVKRPAEWIRSTLSEVAGWPRSIAVAAYNAQENGTPLTTFSAQGPAPNNLSLGLFDPASVIAKPDIAAPGVAIDAPRAEARKCCLECECCVDRYMAETGTSQAAPHITGLIALMFAQNPTLTLEEVKTLLTTKFRDAPPLPPGWPPSAELWGAGKVDAVSVIGAVINPMVAAPIAETQPRPVPARHIAAVNWADRLRGWTETLSARPAFNLFAALVSLHFDEVKRLIDTNRRVGAVWQRQGGPALVRSIVFSDVPPDPPVPSALATAQASHPLHRVLLLLSRYGSEALRADIARYADLLQALPGASWDELDAMVENGGVE